MDVNLLRAFVAVAREGSFSAAACDLGYTQSAVSQQVAALEKDLGVQLLHRRPVIPTEAGQRLLEHATPILLRLNAARTDVQRLSGEPPARLTLGTSPLADVRHTIAVLTELQRSMPRLTIVVRTMGCDGVLEAVANGDADLGLVDGVTAASDPLRLLDSGPLTTVALTEESVAVALPGTHPWQAVAGSVWRTSSTLSGSTHPTSPHRWTGCGPSHAPTGSAPACTTTAPMCAVSWPSSRPAVGSPCFPRPPCNSIEMANPM